MSLTVLFRDDDVVAIDKPVGLASIPERDLTVPSAQRTLEAETGERLFVVHRLDKEVSGLLVFARNAKAHRELSMAFERRTAKKVYRAVLRGETPWDELVVDEPIREFGSGRMGVDPRGKPSRTQFVVLARGEGRTFVRALPHTGRRHQIRVHAYAAGFPLVGDPRYGPKDPEAPRLLLHGEGLSVDLFGRRVDLEAPVPPELTPEGAPSTSSPSSAEGRSRP